MGRPLRWQTRRWGHRWIWGLRRGQWWIGVRRDFPTNTVEIGVLGLTLMIGKD